MTEFRCPLCGGNVPVPAAPGASYALCPDPECGLRIPRAKWPTGTTAPAEPAEPDLVFPPHLQVERTMEMDPAAAAPAERTLEVDATSPARGGRIRVHRQSKSGPAAGAERAATPAVPIPSRPDPLPETPAREPRNAEPAPAKVAAAAEPAAFLQALLSVVALHEGVKSAELAILREHAAVLNVKLRKSELRAYSLDRIAEQIRDRDQRSRLLAEMVRVAEADGAVNAEETALIQHLATRWGLPAPGLRAVESPPLSVKKSTEKKLQALGREDLGDPAGDLGKLAGIVEDDPPLPLDRLPWVIVAMGAGSVAGAVLAWILAAAMPRSGVAGFLQTVDLLLCLATLAGGTALIQYFRYGPRPSRDGARRTSWGTHAACGALLLLLISMAA